MATDEVSTLDAGAYFEGNYAPVEVESTVFDLPIVGQVPEELAGRLLRIGPNPIDDIDMASHHWFLGDGMVHGVRIRDGRAAWYRNRYVRSQRTEQLLAPSAVSAGPFTGASGPNTNVIGHAGRTYALVEAGIQPVELSYELESIATNAFSGTLSHGYSAHPKYDPATGEMHAMCYTWPDLVDQLQYIVVGPDGLVTKTIGITAPTMPMVHDMGLTRTYAVVLDLPVAVDFDLALGGAPFPVRWFEEYNARVGLLRRDATSEADIVWCEIDPCFAFHPLNSYDEADGTVIMDVCEYERIFDRDRNGPFRDGSPTLARWTIDPVAGRVKRETIDDRPQEFPRVAGSVLNTQHRFGYTVGLDVAGDDVIGLTGTHKHDFASGRSETHDHGPGRAPGEPVFVARAGGDAEDDGWLLVTVYDASTDTSDIVILNAGDVAGEEVARVQLPVRIPHGFHGNWVRDTVTLPPG